MPTGSYLLNWEAVAPPSAPESGRHESQETAIADATQIGKLLEEGSTTLQACLQECQAVLVEPLSCRSVQFDAGASVRSLLQGILGNEEQGDTGKIRIEGESPDLHPRSPTISQSRPPTIHYSTWYSLHEPQVNNF